MTLYNRRRVRNANPRDRGYSRDRNYSIIFEFIPQGRYVKVSAIDTRTGTETCIVADRRTRIESLKRIATKKLCYVMNKKYQSEN